MFEEHIVNINIDIQYNLINSGFHNMLFDGGNIVYMYEGEFLENKLYLNRTYYSNISIDNFKKVEKEEII